MESILLASKLRIPPPPHHAIHRARLLDALGQNIPHHKLIIISAPAGYGKTTLLVQWAHSSRQRIAWLTLDEEDNDLEQFLRYLVTAWARIQPEINDHPLGLILTAMGPDTQAALTAFINAANETPDTVVFVLDDYHLMTDPGIRQAVSFLLDHLPPNFHLMISGRGEPDLPLARHRARGELIEFQADDLRFLADEAEEFINQGMRLDLSPDEITALQNVLEGWIAGLQLAALTARRRGRTADGMKLSGRHRFIADYLSEEVLERLPEETRQFLLQTSILESISGPLAEAVTGMPDGQAMLELLEQENLFLIPLDDRREWFRYHRLFGDFLREELQRQHPGEVPDFHRRAAHWYLTHDQPDPAFHHAVQALDADLTFEIAKRYFIMKLLGSEITLVKRWLDALPEAWYIIHPEFGLFQASLLFVTGQFDAAARRLDEVEQLQIARNEHAAEPIARVNAVRCFIACYQNDLDRAVAYAQQALRHLSEDDMLLRRSLYGSLGDSYRQKGLWKEARDFYYKVMAGSFSPDARFYLVHAYGAMADLDLLQGRLRDAAAHWRKALFVSQEPANRGKIPLPVTGWVYIRLGEILYQWNQLREAGEHISQGLDRAELGGEVRALIAGYLAAGQIRLASGDFAGASEYLEKARPLVEQASFPDWISRFERLQVEYWLAQDWLRPAVDWASEALSSGVLESRPESEAAQLAAARVFLVKGDPPSLEKVLQCITRLIQSAEKEGRSGVLIEALALKALTSMRRGDLPSAMPPLERALRLAEPEGYTRLFADLGLPMARLLQEARSRGVMPPMVDDLLEAFSGDLSNPAGMPLPEPLTIREQEILQRIAAGLTNREIAEAFVISPETVKKHLGSIYGKLGVSSRTQAVAKARELRLFE